MRFLKLCGAVLPLLILFPCMALAQMDASGTWTQMFNVPLNPDTMLVLTDGTIAVDDYATSNWYRLVPDQHGHYLNGTWVSMGSMPVEVTSASGVCNNTATSVNANNCPYAPYDYASAVFADGRLAVIGGEYTYDAYGNAYGTETTQGAIWDWHTNTWTVLPAPANWTRVGDANSLVLANGQYVLADNSPSSKQGTGVTTGALAIMNTQGVPTNSLTWTQLAPTGKADSNSEENWVLLPDGSIWTMDISKEPGSERYIPPYLAGNTNGEWINAGPEPALIGVTAYKGGAEDGANVLLPNGQVFAISGNPSTGVNALFTPPTTLMGTGTFAVAPNYPTTANGILTDCDGPASVLPSGNVFFTGSAGCYDIPSEYFEYQPGSSSLVQVVSPYDPVAAATVGSQISSFYSRFVVLPDGTMLYSWDDGLETYIFTPTGTPTAYNPAWAPTITSFPGAMSAGNTYVVSGTQFNGVTASGYYGDDEANASNYPLVRFTNVVTGDVQYGRTHDHSNMGVQTGSAIVSTNVDVPANLEAGPATLQVVTNGIPSTPVTVNQTRPTITWATPAPIASGTALSSAQLDATATFNGTPVAGSFTYTPAAGAVPGIGNQTLSVTFTPTDTASWTTATSTTTLAVLVPPTVTLTATATLTAIPSGYQAVVTVTNSGSASAANVQLTSSTLGSASGTPLPVSLGTIAANGSASTTLSFPASAGSPGAAAMERVGGTYTGGSFGSSSRAMLP